MLGFARLVGLLWKDLGTRLALILINRNAKVFHKADKVVRDRHLAHRAILLELTAQAVLVDGDAFTRARDPRAFYFS